MRSESQTHLVMACSLTEAAFRDRRDTGQRELFSGQTESEAEGDRYRFRFPSDDVWLNRITEFVLAERQCCPFLSFQIEIPADASSIELRLSGPSGSTAFIEQTFLAQSTTT